MEEYFFEVDHYKIEEDPIDFLDESDSVFISQTGLYVNRGVNASYAFKEVHSLLDNLHGANPFDINPFIVFGLNFDPDTTLESLVSLPKEMFHISTSNVVTHFVLGKKPGKKVERIQPTSSTDKAQHIEISSPTSKDQFTDNVQMILKNIETGNVHKAVLARQLLVSSDEVINKKILLKELVSSQPDCFVFSINSFIGASPELLIEKKSRSIRSRPLAGTRKRHARLNEDDASIADLQTHEKDLLEHKVVVEEIVSNLAALSSDITYNKSPFVLRYPHVSHLASEITATSSPDTTMIDLIAAIHPTPAVAGLPTKDAIELLKDIEDFNRGIYAAPIGWIDTKGNGESAIALRCAKIEDNLATLYAGVGIVQGSDPEMEYEETKAKFGVMRDALVNITQ